MLNCIATPEDPPDVKDAGLKRCTLCCVIDQHPRFHVELVLWTICAQRHLPAAAFRLVVYFVGTPPPDLADWLRTRGVETRIIEPVVEGSPHCNKIAPFFDVHDADSTAVVDADLFFVDDPSCFLAKPRFRAPPNNHGNPPPHIFKEILAAAGRGAAYRPGLALYRGAGGMRETHVNNISGGFIASPRHRAAELARLWRKWASWLVENRRLLDRWAGHVDQVAFALTMEELGEDVDFLPPQTNTILHSLGEIATVYAFHLTSGHIPRFAERFNADRTLTVDGVAPGVADAIGRLNACIREATAVISSLPSTRNHVDKFLNPQWQREKTTVPVSGRSSPSGKAFDNQAFWDKRYRDNPALGSGVGSRGANADNKRAVIAKFLDTMRPESILDIGCGDHEVFSTINCQARYRGLDISSTVIEINKARHPKRSSLMSTFRSWRMFQAMCPTLSFPSRS